MIEDWGGTSSLPNGISCTCNSTVAYSCGVQGHNIPFSDLNRGSYIPQNRKERRAELAKKRRKKV